MIKIKVFKPMMWCQDVSAGAYQILLRKRREKALPNINRRSQELRRSIRILTYRDMVDGVNFMIRECEHITRSNHL